MRRHFVYITRERIQIKGKVAPERRDRKTKNAAKLRGKSARSHVLSI